MDNFFNQSFWQQLAVGVIILAIGGVFAASRGSKKPTVHREGSGIWWRIFLVVFRIMFYLGLWIFLANFAVNGIEDVHTGIGLSSTVIGLFGIGITKFIHWMIHGTKI